MRSLLVWRHDPLLLRDDPLTRPVRADGETSGTLRFESLLFDGDITYVECCGVCSQDEQAAACHLDCKQTVPDRTKRLSLINAARYQYEPPPAQDEQRYQWLLSRWAFLLEQKYRQDRAPRELCRQIAQLSLRHFAIANATLFIDTSPSTKPIRISTALWAHYTVFEGIPYIRSLEHRQNDSETLIASGPCLIFFAEDHLGIRSLTEDPGPSCKVKGRAGIWWRMIRSPSLQMSLEVETDVSRLRINCVFEIDIRCRAQSFVQQSVTLSRKYYGRSLGLQRRRFGGTNFRISTTTFINERCQYFHSMIRLFSLTRYASRMALLRCMRMFKERRRTFTNRFLIPMQSGSTRQFVMVNGCRRFGSARG